MEMLLGFIVLLACLIIGVQHGGIGLAAVSGVGLVIFTFVFGKATLLLGGYYC